MNYQDLTKLTTTELQTKIKGEQALFSKLSFAHAITPLENPMQLRKLRKAIARMHTALQSKPTDA